MRRGVRGIAAVSVLLLAGSATAQEVIRVGSSDVSLDRRLAQLLAGDPEIITTDRRIRAGDTIPGSVLVLAATVIHEGTVLGDLVVVDGGAFVRPRAVVRGDLVNIAGGLYRSELARVGGTIIDLPDASYRVVREDERIVIDAYSVPDRLQLDGFAGFRVPVYDRANGVTAVWGASYQLPRLFGATPTLRGRGGWRTEIGEPVYGGSLTVRTGANRADVGYERTAATHDGWVVSELRNSLNYLWDGDDFRNHYDGTRAWLSLGRAFGDASKRFYALLRVAGQIEEATSLEGGNPWHLVGDAPRPNPPVDDGRISSVIGRLDLEWTGLRTDLTLAAEYEAGRAWASGAYVFDRATVWTRFAMRALFDHTLEIRALGQVPVGGDTLPGQRWSLVGGAPTLQTEEPGRYRGDHVAFVQSRYRIPTPETLALPILGAPELHLVHAAGMAWLAGDDRPLIQEIGGRLQFFALYVQYMVQPDRTSAIPGSGEPRPHGVAGSRAAPLLWAVSTRINFP